MALRCLSWRIPGNPPVVPISLAAVPGFQRYRDPADPDGTDRDGWLVLGAADLILTSELVARTSPPVVAAVVAALTRCHARAERRHGAAARARADAGSGQVVRAA